ncbi:MAG TPA: phosphate ABC transporter ATP-binding protein [Syntrophorhabdaceae bacterium]|nr:phosphate ABC transporter ATP-binding protein [Syntrophorhabdaceae bacterium]
MTAEEQLKIRVRDVSFYYGSHQILKNISVDVVERTIAAVIGPSGQGKSTFLMMMNRLWEHIPEARITGKIEMQLKNRWTDIYDTSVSLPDLRRSVGMVFQKPNPLPMSIYRNVAFPLKLAGLHDKSQEEKKVEQALRAAFLWDEVKDRLEQDARGLSGGQQQRLCIARALILGPEVLLMDEPTSSLDTKAAAIIEDLMIALKESCTILLVSHLMDQVSRLADKIMELEDGRFLPPERKW